MTGRDYFIDYFRKTEESLINLSKMAKMPKGDEKDTGDNREYIVSKFLHTHLPKLATVSTGGAIIDSETKFRNKQNQRAQQVDVIVINPFTLISRWFPAGYYPVEAVYLAIEVKSQEIGNAFEQIERIKNLQKHIRPETTYFHFSVEKNTVPKLSARTLSPSAGIWVWPKAKRKNSKKKENNKWISSLEKRVKACLKIRNGVSEEIIKITMPNFLYVPGEFLAFKIYPEIENKETIQKKSEFFFANKAPRQLQFQVNEHPFHYVIYEPEDEKSAPSRLQIFTFWLSQEILKFIHEVPDLFTYAFEPRQLIDRQGYGMKDSAYDIFVCQNDRGKLTWKRKKGAGAS